MTLYFKPLKIKNKRKYLITKLYEIQAAVCTKFVKSRLTNIGILFTNCLYGYLHVYDNNIE